MIKCQLIVYDQVLVVVIVYDQVLVVVVVVVVIHIDVSRINIDDQETYMFLMQTYSYQVW